MLVDYKKVNIYQQADTPVLSDVDFHVDEGEFIYLIGRVGSGKSSLLKTVYFELDVDEAEEATVLGHDLRNLKRKHVPSLRRQMGVIFQDFQLLGDRTVYKNLRFVLKATGWKDKKQIDKRINEVLKALFAKMNIRLVDFKIEFGRTSDGEIILADEVSPDTCRLWDMTTNERLDKDRFRRDLGRVREAYEEILARLKKAVE